MRIMWKIMATYSNLIIPRNFMGSLDAWLAPTMAVWGSRGLSWKLIGFIRAIPANIHIYDTEKKMLKINFFVSIRNFAPRGWLQS